MTGKQLIEWIRNNNAEDLPISINNRDCGLLCEGEESLESPEIIEGVTEYSTGFWKYSDDPNTEDYLYTGKRIVF